MEKDKTTEEDLEYAKGLEEYKKMLEQQREFCEKHGLKVAYITLPKEKKDND